jgi:hypothetical protein
VERRIERPVLDLEHLLGSVLDGVRDGMAVRGADGERLQNQQVERPLEQFALNGRVSAFGHEGFILLQKIIYLKLGRNALLQGI